MTATDAGADAPTPPEGGYQPPSAKERLAILQRTRTIAIVGASSKPSRSSYFVATYLLSSSTDYTVWFVNPRETSILGHEVYPSLAALPEPPDIVDVFRKTDELAAVASECVEVGAGTFWAQLGLWSEEAARVARSGGLNVVMDRCIKIEHARFAGGLHLAGFDTGVISARRAPAPGARPR